MQWLTVDGSYGEGGGQLSRYAVALAAITGRPLHLTGIRARRPKPGLMAQHLTALRAVARVAGGVLEGAELGSTEVHFRPGPIQGGHYHFEVGTAGSVVLVLQALLPVALKADGPIRLVLGGGTDVAMAPPLDYLRHVFLPWLTALGAEVRIESARHGYYPKGGGQLTVAVRPCHQFAPLVAETPGPLRAIRGRAHVTHLPPHIPERMAAAARQALTGFAPIQVEARVLDEAEGFGIGGALVLAAETEHGVVGAATVAQRGVPAERLGRAVGQALRADLEAGAALDEHAADQLLLYAAQARGRSLLTVRRVSLHAQTVLWLLEQFLPVRFRVEPWRGLQQIEVSHG